MDAGFRYPEILAASFTDLPLSRALWAKANRSVTKYLPGVLSMAFLKAVANEVMERLMQMSARTCYLHAALGQSLAPKVSLVLNDQAMAV